MTNPVIEARDRANAAILHWRNVRRQVNDPTLVPERLDELVNVAEKTIALVSQDIAVEVEAIIVEIEALIFPVDPGEDLRHLEEATYAVDGALGRLRRASSNAGYADADDDFKLPPGLKVPKNEIAQQLERFVSAVEEVGPILSRIAQKQNSDENSANWQGDLVRHFVERTTIKLDLAQVKAASGGLIDISGLAAIGRQLVTALTSFTNTVIEGSGKVSEWLATHAPQWIEPLIKPLQRGLAGMASRVAAWLNRNTRENAEARSRKSTGFNFLEIRRRVQDGSPPPEEAIPFLTVLELDDVTQASIEALSPARELRWLSVEGNFADLEPIAHLPSLQHLSVTSDELEDIRPLGALSTLNSLEIYASQVKDISPLAALAELRSLDLFCSKDLYTLRPLSALKQLQRLSVYEGGGQSLEPLNGLELIEELSLYKLSITNIEPLKHLRSLKTLRLTDSKASDIGPLRHCRNLTSLMLENASVTDLAPLADLILLERLYANRNSIKNLGPIAKMSKLQDLSIDYTEVGNTAALAELGALSSFSANFSKISDLSGLAKLTRLRVLSLNHTPVRDVSPLRDLQELERLSLDNTSVNNLAPLAGLSKLRSLSIDHTSVRDLSPLAALPSLQSLETTEGSIGGLDALRKSSSLRMVTIRGNPPEEIIRELGSDLEITDLSYGKKVELRR